MIQELAVKCTKRGHFSILISLLPTKDELEEQLLSSFIGQSSTGQTHANKQPLLENNLKQEGKYMYIKTNMKLCDIAIPCCLDNEGNRK